MSGLVSLYPMSKYSGAFGGADCLSTHWMGFFEDDASLPLAAFDYLQAHVSEPGSHRPYVDYGTQELAAQFRVYQAPVDEIVREGGCTSANGLSSAFVGAGHNAGDRSARLDVPLSFVMARPRASRDVVHQ